MFKIGLDGSTGITIIRWFYILLVFSCALSEILVDKLKIVKHLVIFIATNTSNLTEFD